ncbi:hypothetical protein KIN20_019193 [Parelaphostrongylus tenuis]|uniref:Uncharacterized protein n=1 Tax=Parelaphostrongylus tenuis TaxID=148309 RepID=A0AAD5QUX1_PARTN|nr:hypothetical protein KIN20_019193 [Parelaphostrongylus tenuis]
MFGPLWKTNAKKRKQKNKQSAEQSTEKKRRAREKATQNQIGLLLTQGAKCMVNMKHVKRCLLLLRPKSFDEHKKSQRIRAPNADSEESERTERSATDRQKESKKERKSIVKNTDKRRESSE